MKFDLTGYNIDNLIKTLYSKKITLYNLKRIEHNHVIFDVEDKDTRRVKRYINNFKVKQVFSLKKRFPKIILANLGLILAIFFGSIFMIFVSNYTWQIRVYGTEELIPSEIIDVLKENGIKTGKINLQTSEEIENILLNKYDRIAQVSVIRQGTAIIINISEKLVYIESEYQPITAKYAGIITDINLITGTINVKVGDYVNIGDILVLPFNLDSNGNKVSVRPMAEISAEISIISCLEMPKNETELVRTGNSITCYEYKIFNKHIFSGKSKNSFALFERVVYNESISDLLPLSRDVVKYYELDYVNITHDFITEKEDLILKSKEKAYENLPKNVEIISETTETNIILDSMFATTTLKVQGTINA